MKRARIAARARLDVRETTTYLESQRHGYGRRFLVAFQKTLRRIERSPKSIAFYGFKSADVADVRVSNIAGFENWLVFFRVAPESVHILRVIHGARHIDEWEDESLPE